jgi:hypothetical protein
MKRLSNALAALLAVACLATAAAAQATPGSELEKDIAAAEKRLNELKQKKRDELQKQIRALQAELDGVGVEAAPAQQPPPPDAGAGNQPDGGAAGRGHGGGGDSAVRGPAAAPAAVASTAAASTAGGVAQTDDLCQQAATGASLSRQENAICDLSRDIVRGPDMGLSVAREQSLLLTVIAGRLAQDTDSASSLDAAVRDFVIEAEPKRTDKQIGADPKSSGTTSLVVKGGIPSVLGWATEHGAAVASRDGTDVTFRFNPVGVVEALSGAGYISSFRSTENDPMVKFLRNTSVGVTFDTTRGTDSPTLVGSKQQVSAVSFRYQFVNQRDPRSARYRDKWRTFLNSAGLDFTTAATNALMQLQTREAVPKFRNTALQSWVEGTVAAVAAKKSELTAMKAVPVTGEQAAIVEVSKIIEQRLADLPAGELASDPTIPSSLNGFFTSLAAYTTEKNNLLGEINKGTVISFEYTNHREVDAPDLSNFRFIAERGTVGGLDFTGNASVTIFNKRPADPDSKRIKDFSFALQLDKRLKNTMGLGDSQLSFAGKFERAESNAVALDGTALPNTKGDIAAGQIKLTIPLGQTGIKLPFSVTFANRTELVREKEVRGNFGFTLDFDSLFARFKPF